MLHVAVCLIGTMLWGLGGCSSSDSSTGSQGSGGSSTGTAGTSGQPSCSTTECFRPYECVRQCGGEVVRSGCCACEAPLIDKLYCDEDAQGGSTDAATPGDSSPGATTCEPNAATIMKCPALGNICTGTDMCCKCIDFPQAPS